MRKVFCHIYIVLVTLMCFCGNGYALEFKVGNYFFDNSKLHFSTVKMVLGNQDSTLVFEMLPTQLTQDGCKQSFPRTSIILQAFVSLIAIPHKEHIIKVLLFFLMNCPALIRFFVKQKLERILAQIPITLLVGYFAL